MDNGEEDFAGPPVVTRAFNFSNSFFRPPPPAGVELAEFPSVRFPASAERESLVSEYPPPRFPIRNDGAENRLVVPCEKTNG